MRLWAGCYPQHSTGAAKAGSGVGDAAAALCGFECRYGFLFSERQLRRSVSSHVEHYHLERPHQGLGNQVIDNSRLATNTDNKVVCDERLGGLLKSYRRSA